MTPHAHNYSVHNLTIDEVAAVHDFLNDFRNGSDQPHNVDIGESAPMHNWASGPAADPAMASMYPGTQPGPLAGVVNGGVAGANPLAPIAGAAVDKHGVPWHPAVHSSTQTQTKDGRWILKKGGDKTFGEAYLNQFRTTGAGGGAGAGAATGGVQQQMPPANSVVAMVQGAMAPVQQDAPPAFSAPTWKEFYDLYHTLYDQGKGPLGPTQAAEMHQFSGIPATAGAQVWNYYQNDERHRQAGFDYLLRYGRQIGRIA